MFYYKHSGTQEIPGTHHEIALYGALATLHTYVRHPRTPGRNMQHMEWKDASGEARWVRRIRGQGGWAATGSDREARTYISSRVRVINDAQMWWVRGVSNKG